MDTTQTKEPTLFFDDFPEWFREDLARTVVRCVKEFKAQPGGQEFLDRKIREKREAAERSDA